MIGEAIGRYRLKRLVGVGGFASVYEAHDEALDTLVAVKVLADNHSLDPEARSRFIAEGRLLRRVDHPNIVTVHDIGETERQQPYLVLQYAAGGSLAERLTEPHRLVTEADVSALTDALSGALSALHAEGIVHRDLSPSNVFVGQTGEHERRDGVEGSGLFDARDVIMLGDLGLAKDLARSSGMTVGAGTGDYAAPEQMDSFGQVSTAADVYGASALLRRVAAGTDLADAVDRATESGMAQEPAERPASIGAWRAEVKRSLASDLTTPATRRPQRSRTVALAGLCAVVVAGLVGIAGWRSLGADGRESVSTVIFDDGFAPGWADASWGRPDTLTTTGVTRLVPFGAVSFVAQETIVVDADQWVTLTLRDLTPAATLQLRANDADGNALAPCLVSGTDLMRLSDDEEPGDVTVVVPFSLLSLPADEVSRLSLIEAAGEEVAFRTVRVQITDAPQIRPTATSCG